MRSDSARFLQRADRAVEICRAGRGSSETSFLQHIISGMGDSEFEPGLSPAALYRAAMSGWTRMEGARSPFVIVALPSRPPRTPLCAGDWMLRVTPGTGNIGHVSVLASDDLLPRAALRAEGITPEGTQPGHYGVVIEGGPFPHGREELFARRFLDGRGLLPVHAIILRPASFDAAAAEQSGLGSPRKRTPLSTREPYFNFGGAPVQADTEDDQSGTIASPWPARLDAKLTEVAKPHPLRAAVDIVAETSRFKGMTFALADLSTSGTRAYAGAHDKEQRFIASTGKLAILFAAFQLRKSMREAAATITDKRVANATQLFAAVTGAWCPRIQRYFHGTRDKKNAPPSLAQIFNATQRSAGGWDIDFADTPRGGEERAFADRLKSAVMNSNDDDAGSCIRDLGFPYIHGCLAEAGLWQKGKGLWIALDYAGGLWWQDALDDAGSTQAATARTLVEMLTLLEFDELVPGSRTEMLDLLSGARGGVTFGVISYIQRGVTSHLSNAEKKTLDVRAKVGYTGKNTHGDAAIVRHSSQAGDLRYVVAILNGLDGATAEEAARALDIALTTAHQPAVHESEDWHEAAEEASSASSEWPLIVHRSRSRAPTEEFEPDEDFTFNPTANEPGFDAKLLKGWHTMISDTFKANEADIAEMIRKGLSLPDTPTGLAAAKKNIRFFSSASRPPTIALTPTSVNWAGFPLGRGDPSLKLYKYFDALHDLGSGRMLRDQDEYCEWSVFRNSANQIVRVVFTSWPPEFFRFLYNPSRFVPAAESASIKAFSQGLLVSLYQKHCGNSRIALADLEIGAGSSKKYDSGNRWNTEQCLHLQQPSNNLGAEINIAALASIVRRDAAGQLVANVKVLNDCANRFGDMPRRSDPAIADAVNGAARENRFLTLENPVGLYMTSLDTTGWETPDGADPQGFWKVLTGTANTDLDRSMIVRAEYTVPAGNRYTVSDIKIGGVPIRFGGQIAEHVQVRLGALVGPKNTDLTGGKLDPIVPVPCI
jgi:hypothetical protein